MKVTGKDTATVINALIQHTRTMPKELHRPLTWDHSKEMVHHQRFTLASDIRVYLCESQNPWQRGSNENTNGLLRQYSPKGTYLSGYSEAKLNAVAKRLNARPRKALYLQAPTK